MWAGLAERNQGEAADFVGRAGLTGNWDSELIVDYGRGCHGGINSQSHMRVRGNWG